MHQACLDVNMVETFQSPAIERVFGSKLWQPATNNHVMEFPSEKQIENGKKGNNGENTFS